MERFTVSIDEALASSFDVWLKTRGYQNRSEGFRDLLRAELERQRQNEGRWKHCVACLSYVYNHHQRELAARLAALHHDHHPLVVAATRVPLDHEQCLQTTMLRGPTSSVQVFSDAICALRGVRHGALNLISVQVSAESSHGHGALGQPHVHLTPAD